MSVKLATTLASARDQIRVLSRIESGLPAVSAGYQPLVAELIALRLFSVWEQSVSEIATKIACGALFLDGSTPILLAPRAKSLEGARQLFCTFNRPRATNPNWSKSTFVVDTVEKVFDPASPFLKHVRNHGALINEIRVIRNFSAHRNASARAQFKQLTKSKLGADLRLSAGQLLLTKRQNPLLIRRYLTSVGVALADICSGI